MALVVLSATRPAMAEPSVRVRLRYLRDAGAAQCPEEPSLRDGVAGRLGFVPWDEHAPTLIIVTVAVEGRGLRARVERRGTDGKVGGVRELSSINTDCVELAAAVELAVSLAIDPLSLGGPSASQPASRQAEVEPVAPRSPAAVAPRRPDDRAAPPKQRLGVAASVGGIVAVGSAPSSVAGGLRLQARLRWRAASFAVEGRLDLPGYRDVPGGQISSSLVVAGLVGCYHHGWLLGCGVVNLGALRAAGHEIKNAESLTLFYAAGGLRLGLEVPVVSVLAVQLHADLLATFSRITLRDSETHAEIWSTPPLSGAFGLAAVGRFR
jgi:hypothetical protein